jgi:hypothetical protein
MTVINKHYYNDLGILDYQWEANFLTQPLIAKIQDESTIKQRSLFIEAAMGIIYEFTTTKALNENGIEDFFSEHRECPIEMSLLPILKDFTEQGFIPQEFTLVAMALISNAQLEFALS